MNSPNPYHSPVSGSANFRLGNGKAETSSTEDVADEGLEEAKRTAEWELKALMAGYGAFFIGAIKSFLLLDATGSFLLITAGLAAAGAFIVGLILVSRMRRNRKMSYRDIVILAVLLGVSVALTRNALATQERWQHVRARLDAMRTRLSQEENSGDQLNRRSKDEPSDSDSDQ